jgi:DNA topoisomerase-6 subunit A
MRLTSTTSCIVPQVSLGVTPQDIIDFGLEDATLKLESDRHQTRSMHCRTTFICAHPEWIAAIKQLLKMGVRAEQQALAKWGLNYVIDEYLPRKLAKVDSFLP